MVPNYVEVDWGNPKAFASTKQGLHSKTNISIGGQHYKVFFCSGLVHETMPVANNAFISMEPCQFLRMG